MRQAGAHVVSGVMVQADAPDRARTRLERGMAIESLEPEKALSLYMEKSSVAAERRTVLMQAAREIINSDQMGQGADVDDKADVVVRIAEEKDMEAIFALRRLVFIDEQNVDADEEWDGRDEDAVHAVALMEDEVVGTGRLLTDEGEETCRIGRMAVRQDLRRHGIGDKILATLEEVAGERGFAQVLLNAQTYVKDFYSQAGYREHGEIFLEAGIERRSRWAAVPVGRPAAPNGGARKVPGRARRHRRSEPGRAGPPRPELLLLSTRSGAEHDHAVSVRDRPRLRGDLHPV